ncbi:uncharacterized protein LOC117224680 [Megalopta genalis]|uniref:uncharacterized protein LOC117224680 n=1 Tax=Megalopta genalis TaxID=115081 RepID=UPI003FD2089E
MRTIHEHLLPFIDCPSVSLLSFSAEADGEKHRESGIQEEADALQVPEVRQVLPAGDVVEEAPEARVRRGAEAELPDLREEVHPQVQDDPSPGLLQKKTGIVDFRGGSATGNRSRKHRKKHQRTSRRSQGRSNRNSARDYRTRLERTRDTFWLLATMLLSQDIHQPRGNSDALWNQLCYADAPYKLNRTQRVKEQKDGDTKYPCNRCGKTYKATTSLSRHKRLECGVVPCEVCPICDRRFKHRFVLNSHIVGCQKKLRHIMDKCRDSPVFDEPE